MSKIEKARDAHQERSVAQGECAKMLNQLGYSKKEADDVTCYRCGTVVHRHTESGIADYMAITRSRVGPLAYAVEVKGGGLVFPMNRIDDDQWAWLHDWQSDTGGRAWFWLLMGTERVDSKSPFRKTTFLVPYDYMLNVRTTLSRVTNGQNTSLPLNDKVERVYQTIREKGLFADERFAEFELDWLGSKIGWWMPESHPWWNLMQTDYWTPKEANHDQSTLF